MVVLRPVLFPDEGVVAFVVLVTVFGVREPPPPPPPPRLVACVLSAVFALCESVGGFPVSLKVTVTGSEYSPSEVVYTVYVYTVLSETLVSLYVVAVGQGWQVGCLLCLPHICVYIYVSFTLSVGPHRPIW